MKRLGSFLDGIYGFDGMSCFLLAVSVILNLLTGLWPSQAVNNVNLISYLPLLWCIFRVFSHNYEKREQENEKFLHMIRPICENVIEKREEKAEAKLFRFFKCPLCKQKLRVPKGKGKVEITCPKCGNKFIKKEIICKISKQKNARYKMYRAFLSYLFCVINLQKLLLLDTEQHKRHNLHKRQHRSHNDLLPER